MVLKVRVVGPRTRAWHGLGLVDAEGDPRRVEGFGEAAWLEIREEDYGCFLIRYDARGAFAGDTWHGTVEEAKEAARCEYDLAGKWETV